MMYSSQENFKENYSRIDREQITSRQNDGELSINNSNYGKTISIFQPKLLKMKGFNTMQQPRMDELYVQEKKRVKKKIKQLKREEEELKQDNKLPEKVLSFYKNPFQYMDYLIETYFRTHFGHMASTMDFNKLKLNQTQNTKGDNNKQEDYKKLLKEFEKISKKTKEEIKQIVETEINKKLIYQETNQENFINTQKSDFKFTRKYRDNEPDAEEIKSEPVDQNEIINAFFNNSNSNKFKTVIHSRPDIKNSILNDRYSSLNKENLLKKTLHCLKGEKLELPKQNFLKINELNINDTNKDEMIYTKNLLDIQRQFDHIRHNAENTIIEQIEKTMQKEQDIYNNLMNKAQSSVNKMEEGNKVTEELLAHVKTKLNEEFNKEVVNLGIKQLNIHEKNLDEIRRELNSGNKDEQNIERMLERVKMIEENNKKTEEEIERFLKEKGLIQEEKNETELSDQAIDKLYNKYKPKPKKKNTFSYNSNFNPSFKKPANSKKVVRPTTNMVNLKYK